MFDRAKFRVMLKAQMGNAPLRSLAPEIGVSISTLSRLANGELPDIETFASIIEWLGVSAETFFVAEPVQRPTSDERLLAIGYALYGAALPEELNEAILTIVRLIQNTRNLNRE